MSERSFRVKVKAKRPVRSVAPVATPPSIGEGLYCVELLGERHVVKVLDVMQGQWPCTRSVLTAFFMSGPTRFPWSVSELNQVGACFKPLA